MLFTKPQVLDECAVPLYVFILEVVEQATPLANQLEQSVTCRVIVGMFFEVVGEVADALTEDRDLHFGCPGVVRAIAVLLDQLAFAFFCNHTGGFRVNSSLDYTMLKKIPVYVA